MKIVFVINTLIHYHIFNGYIERLFGLAEYEITVVLVNPELAVKEEGLKQFAKVIKLFNVKNDIREKVKGNRVMKAKPFYFYWLYFIYLFWKHYKIHLRARKIINEVTPDFVIISSDRYTDFDLFFAKNCNKKNIPVAVLGIDYFYVETFDSYLKSDSRRKISNLKQRIISKLFPTQVFKANGDSCLYYPVHLTLNLFFMNALPSRPYLTGSRFVNQIHVESEYTKLKYIENNIPEKLIHVVGLLEHDLIYSSLQNKLSLKKLFRLDSSKKIVILAVPQGWEHQLLGKDEHFKIIENIITIIFRSPVNLLLSLHPKMDIDNYLYLESKFHLQISRIPLRDFICISDIFIATYSSTVLWSAILNIPCLVFDFYNLNYNCYFDLQNIRKAKSYAEFEVQLAKILEYDFDTLQDNNKNFNSKQFGLIDNGAFSRFLRCIHERK